MIQRRGHSLVEVVLVLAILTLLGGLALPRYAKRVNQYEVDMAVKQLVGALNQARTLAQAQSIEAEVHVHSNRLEIKKVTGVLPETDDARLQIKVGDRIATLDMVEGEDKFTFDANGRVNQATTIQLQCGQATRTVVIAHPSGEVQP